MEYVNLTREVEAIKIPEGDKIALPVGSEVCITQSLGGSYTVTSRSHGGLFRISGQDADALGMDVVEPQASASDGDIEQQIESALKSCYDPEIPVNIVDLGLVYDTRIASEPDGSSTVAIKMTLTAQGCGMGAAIAADAEEKLRMLPGVSDASVELVWDPPWGPQMISEEGRKILGI